jgi:hypothetical protein
LRFVLRDSISAGILKLSVRIEDGRVGSNMEGVWSMEIGGTERNGGGVLDLDVE